MLEILYQDADLVAINKPADLLSVPGRGADKQDCAWRRVQQQFPTARVVHRLDYATSGILLFALNAATQRNISMAFQNRQTEKQYQAVVAGIISAETGSVELPMRCDWDNRPLQIIDHRQGKPALTYWRKLTEENRATRVELKPVTGRSHQLRVHMQAMGHPILGDRFYAEPETIALSDRLLLHAERLCLPHPGDNRDLVLVCPCPF